MMRIVFMGTPEFAVPSLEICTTAHDVVAVFTQSDKPAGRGKKMTFPPVKERAIALGIPVYQPENINSPEPLALLRSLAPDLIVVVAYGQLLKQELLDLPRLGCINVHGSLLPKLRGAAPVQFAILNGFKETGVTTMFMAKGLDSGDMLLKRTVPIGEKTTAGELHDLLMAQGAAVLSDTLLLLESGNIIRVPQLTEEATYCSLIRKEMACIDWQQSAVYIDRQIRAFNPWPVAYTTLNAIPLKIYEATVMDIASDEPAGTVLSATSKGIEVACGEGVLNLQSIQTPGAKRMPVSAYLLGHPMVDHTVLGD